MAYPRFRRARTHKKVSLSSGNVTVNGTSFAGVTGVSDIVLPALVGDDIEVGALGLWGAEGVHARLDVATIVSAAIVHYFVNGTDGNVAWIGLSGVTSSFGGGSVYTIQSGDLASGTVTLRLVAKTDSSTNKTFQAGTNDPFIWWAKNLGPSA